MQKGVALALFARSARRTLSWLQAALFSAACSCRLRPRGSGASSLAFSTAKVQLASSNRLSRGDESSIAAANDSSETSPMVIDSIQWSYFGHGEDSSFHVAATTSLALSLPSNSHIGRA